MITGRSAHGKSVTAVSLAKDFEKRDYRVFYHSFKFENSKFSKNIILFLLNLTPFYLKSEKI